MREWYPSHQDETFCGLEWFHLTDGTMIESAPEGISRMVGSPDRLIGRSPVAKNRTDTPLDCHGGLRYSTFMPDPLDHPDLTDIGRVLQRRFDRILESEQAAAELLARRTATLRDRLIDAEDQGGHVTIATVTGDTIAGVVDVVASDHVEIRLDRVSTLVAFDQIATVVMT